VQLLTSRAGSAGGPEPGRAGFYLELGRVAPFVLMAMTCEADAALGITLASVPGFTEPTGTNKSVTWHSPCD